MKRELTVPDNAVVVRLKRRSRRVGERLRPHEVSPVTDSVPIPQGPLDAKGVYPFATMSVGDSFTIPGDRLQSMRVCMSRWRRLNFPARRFGWKREGQKWRVWRTA